MFIVELEKNCWIAPWDGDPGRTIVKKNARKFNTIEQAKLALEVCRTWRPFKNARILEYKTLEFDAIEVKITPTYGALNYVSLSIETDCTNQVLNHFSPEEIYYGYEDKYELYQLLKADIEED